jgi:general stress protein CsbA
LNTEGHFDGKGAQLSGSALRKQIGRISFLLSSLAVAATGGGALQLMHAHEGSRRVSLAVEYGLVLLGVFWLRSLERRLRDAGLPRWLFWPYFLFVFTVCLGARARGMVNETQMLLLFVALQLPTVLFRSKPTDAESLPRRAGRATAESDFKYNLPVGRFLFLLRLVLLAAFWAALFHLSASPARGLALWEMRLGLVILAFVWVYNVEGRLLDAGLPHVLSIPYCLIVPCLCLLPVWLKLVDPPLALALFVLLQLPTVFFYRKAKCAAPLRQNASREEIQEPSSLPGGKPIEPIGGFEFAVYILLIAGLWSGLHLLRGDAVGGGARAWAWEAAVDAVSLLLGALWIVSVKARLKAVGRTRFYLDLGSIVFLPCLLLLAFEVINVSQALVLFVVLQIPVVLMRRKSILARLFLAGADS